MSRRQIDVLYSLKRRPLGFLCLALLLAGVLALTVALFFSRRPAIPAEQNWQAVRARGVWRVGIDPGVYPFSFYGPQGWEGFDADLMREISRRLGLQIQAVPVGYDGFYDAITAGHVDLAMSALVADPARMSDFRYSRPYIDVGLRVIYSTTMPLHSADDLRGRCVAVALGSEADRMARWLARRIPRIERRVTSDEDQAVAAVHVGRCDSAIVSGRRGLLEGCPPAHSHLLKKHPNCFLLQPKAYVVAFARQDERSSEIFDATLGEVMGDGAFDRIAERWLSER